ncbi:hypothetical protein EST38_g7811 [Candolleomyces aberdarensis]|uniref:UBA domain-containing protein n=1 Tax=Candolleomyces aberdarensis TaxID=2316362 RepID=A0A4V1Q3B8_9AGAR|nr:hypothetical protein EST38_g7811 [Candolleomyces aberdarensis]
MADLADGEPAVLEAQSAVSNIKRQHLQEARMVANLPEAVKLAIESICTILGHKIDSWRTVQGIIRRDDFIQRIVNFDTATHMTKPLREIIKKDFLSRPSYDFETVNRASKACGPLAKWVLAQVHFSEILDRVEPLRNEVRPLEDQAETTKKQGAAIIDMGFSRSAAERALVRTHNNVNAAAELLVNQPFPLPPDPQPEPTLLLPQKSPSPMRDPPKLLLLRPSLVRSHRRQVRRQSPAPSKHLNPSRRLKSRQHLLVGQQKNGAQS